MILLCNLRLKHTRNVCKQKKPFEHKFAQVWYNLNPLLFGTFPIVIETDFFILSSEQYDEFKKDADELNLSLDYFLLEFCDVIGEQVIVEWNLGPWNCLYSISHTQSTNA